jgi:hypothetical protein
MTAVVASTYRGSMAYRQIKAFSIIDKHEEFHRLALLCNDQ